VEHQQHRRRHKHRNKPDAGSVKHSSPTLENIDREIDSIDKPNQSERPQHRRPHGSKPFMSIVIPLLNEEESLYPLYEALEEVVPGMSNGQYEILFIDDGSTDTSFSVIRKIHEKNPRYKAIRFRRNCGKSAALAVGFAAAKGKYVFTMDADLQDDPKELPGMLALIEQGYDLVSGWKKKRHDPWHKTIPSRFFNFVTSRMSGISLHDFNCGLKAYRREVVKTLQVYGEMHRYLPALAHWEGFRVTEMPVLHHPRKFGYSKFGFSRFFKGFLDLLTVMFTTRYVKRPLHLFGTIGSIMVLAGLITNIYLTVEWAMGLTFLSQRPLALFGIAMIIVGVQLISTGLIGELVVKNSLEKTTYSVRETLD
jgi:glycosyltransferase involved in cell wall biosynthesis